MLTKDVVLIDACSGDWLNNYFSAEVAFSAWYGLPHRMQDRLALVVLDGGGHIISVLEGAPGAGVRRVDSQQG